ncbi:MAG: hypothetical protein QW594_03440 [Candidatus Woesearchaeota archaeon]
MSISVKEYCDILFGNLPSWANSHQPSLALESQEQTLEQRLLTEQGAGKKIGKYYKKQTGTASNSQHAHHLEQAIDHVLYVLAKYASDLSTTKFPSLSDSLSTSLRADSSTAEGSRPTLHLSLEILSPPRLKVLYQNPTTALALVNLYDALSSRGLKSTYGSFYSTLKEVIYKPTDVKNYFTSGKYHGMNKEEVLWCLDGKYIGKIYAYWKKNNYHPKHQVYLKQAIESFAEELHNGAFCKGPLQEYLLSDVLLYGNAQAKAYALNLYYTLKESGLKLKTYEMMKPFVKHAKHEAKRLKALQAFDPSLSLPEPSLKPQQENEQLSLF